MSRPVRSDDDHRDDDHRDDDHRDDDHRDDEARAVVTTLLELSGLHPAEDEVAAMVRGYPARRAALDAMYVLEADDESPAPEWLYRGRSA